LQKAPPPLGRARAETALSKKRAAGGDSGKVKELGRSTSQVVKKKRGRPQTITDEKKAAALQLKKSGGTNKQGGRPALWDEISNASADQERLGHSSALHAEIETIKFSGQTPQSLTAAS
jgi:hypothetical protein